MPDYRIASLVPSLTELIAELGLSDCLVARTGYCLHPQWAVKRVPKVGGTKDVNLAKLERLGPTHVLVNKDENRREVVDRIRRWPKPPIVLETHPVQPQDNLDLVAQVAAAFALHPAVGPRASALDAALRCALDATGGAGFEDQRVLYLIWCEPWMTVARDTYISRMLARVGWQTLPDVCGGPVGASRYPVVEPDETWLKDVQRVLLSSEPYAFGGEHIARARALCPNARVDLVDGALISWYGPRAVAGLHYLKFLAQPGT